MGAGLTKGGEDAPPQPLTSSQPACLKDACRSPRIPQNHWAALLLVIGSHGHASQPRPCLHHHALGCWSSDAFLRHIRQQVTDFGSDVASKMIQTPRFHHVPSLCRDDPRSHNPLSFAAKSGLGSGCAANRNCFSIWPWRLPRIPVSVWSLVEPFLVPLGLLASSKEPASSLSLSTEGSGPQPIGLPLTCASHD